MRAAFFLLVLSVVLLGCSTTAPPGPISQVNSETQVVLQSETDNHEVTQEFDLNNCDGKADATRTEHRSSSIDVTLSTELAARIGASAQVVSTEVEAAVGTALRIGGERGTSIELKAPPNTHMFFQLVWIGKSQIGVVQNVKDSGIPVAFQTFVPNNVRIKSQYDIGCPTPATGSQPQEVGNTSQGQAGVDSTQGADNTSSAGSTMPILYQTEFLGEWLFQQPRSPMPPPAGSGQIILAHGDIDNSGTCHVKEFGPGEQVAGLGLGSFKLWLITGDTEYIREVTDQIQRGAASHAGTNCPYLP